MLIDSSEVPALQTFKSSVSCVPIGDASDPVTEEVVSVGTLQELVDRVRADKSKKKVFIPTDCLHSSLPLYRFNQYFTQRTPQTLF
ncbi:hypothetical protein HanIR_Chr08g0379151 [Helianthus annuus]|nr:hypothetical protein HanIR_Chr08g0379151 [Helianthus annuus]